MNYSEIFPKIVSHCKETGFIFPSSEIYDGLSAVYDYGPLGVLLKRNIAQLWWKSMVQFNDNIFGLDAAILMHPKVWKASGHVDAFNDPLIDNKDSKKRYRADTLIEDYIQKLESGIQKDAEKKAKKENWTPGDPAYQNYILKHRDTLKVQHIRRQLTQALEANDLVAIKQLIEDCQIADPETGSKNWTDVRQFNLMFGTRLGSVADDSAEIYLRPETAQGIFVNFLNVQKTMRARLPFGIAQIGKAFRNEIVARQFIFRMREFEQMEMQFFVTPGSQHQWFEYWKQTRMAWHELLGILPHRLRFKVHDKLAHYADAAVDIEYEYPFGFKEMEGIHSRTDFDLKQHQEFSGKKLQYFDPETQESYIPYVIETSVGLDRCFLVHLCNAYQEEMAPTADGGSEERIVLKLHPLLAPVQVAVLPLVRKDGMPEVAEKIFKLLQTDFQVITDDKDAIGRRYRRNDARGTPYCITVDGETLTDNTVTVRNRDTMQQQRIHIDSLQDFLAQQFRVSNFFM
jgi:glycyl-tRNA synthetase